MKGLKESAAKTLSSLDETAVKANGSRDAAQKAIERTHAFVDDELPKEKTHVDKIVNDAMAAVTDLKQLRTALSAVVTADRERLVAEATATLDALRNDTIDTASAVGELELVQVTDEQVKTKVMDKTHEQKNATALLNGTINELSTQMGATKATVTTAAADVQRAIAQLNKTTNGTLPYADTRKRMTAARTKADKALDTTRQRIDAAKEALSTTFPMVREDVAQKTLALNETVEKIDDRKAMLTLGEDEEKPKQATMAHAQG